MLRVETIYIHNFRNHDNIHIDFTNRVNVIWGENGSGKTAILEAIYTLSMGRSFRTKIHREMLKDGCEKMSINGIFVDNKQKQSISLNQLSNGQRRFLIDKNKSVIAKELVGQNPIVILSPEEQKISKGPPSDRREYFDKIFSIVSKKYLKTLVLYQRIIKQRNTAIRDLKQGKAGINAIKAWNDPMIGSGIELWKMRKELITVFKNELSQSLRRYESKNIILNLLYESDETSEIFEKRLEKSLNSDIHKGWTTIGPHRDKYSFLYNKRSLREFGSQGEHKLALILIKTAEMMMINKMTGKTPILMFDDLFAKLDFQRADNVLSLLDRKGQTIITTTDIVDFEKHGLNMSSAGNSICYLERPCKL